MKQVKAFSGKRLAGAFGARNAGAIAGVLLLLIWLGYVAWTEYIGINFGSHWDEWKILSSVKDSFATGLFLPNWYNYPSVSYNLTVVSAIIRYLPDWGNITESVVHDLEVIPGELGIFTRISFMLVTLSSVLWVYFAILAWRKRWLEALLGAALLASSWEVAYHARWIAPDGIMMQFGIATLAAIMIGMQEGGNPNWIRIAALLAGLACGSKYPGGILLLPVLLAGFNQKADVQNWRKWFSLLPLVLLFAAGFIFSTPGVLLQPYSFWNDLQAEMSHYRMGHSFVMVNPITEHGYKLLVYLGSVVFSHYWPIALTFSILAITGVIYSFINDRWKTLVFLSAPFAYLLYFITQKVMFARNYLLLIPFLAVFAAHGAVFIYDQLQQKSAKLIFSGVLIAMLVLNGAWLYQSARTIQYGADINPVKDVLVYLISHSRQKFYLSPALREQFSEEELDSFSNVTDKIHAADQYMYMYLQEYENDWEDYNYLSNVPGRYHLVSGTYAVNLDYYPFWTLPDIRTVSVEDAHQIFGTALK